MTAAYADYACYTSRATHIDFSVPPLHMKHIRTLTKGVLFLVSLVFVAPLIVLCWVEKRFTHSEWVFTGCSQTLAVVPTMAGVLLRSAFYFGTLDECDWEVHVGFGTIFSHRTARLARHTSIGAYCVLGQAHIATGAMIGSRVSIPSGKRQHMDNHGRLSTSTNLDVVRIGEGTWIGEGAIVVADVGHHCIVAAGAVVVNPVAPRCLVGGNPGHVLKKFSDE